MSDKSRNKGHFQASELSEFWPLEEKELSKLSDGQSYHIYLWFSNCRSDKNNMLEKLLTTVGIYHVFFIESDIMNNYSSSKER